MSTFDPREFISRLTVEERDGGLYAAGVRIHPDDERAAFEAATDARLRRSLRKYGAPLSVRTFCRIDDGLNAQAQAAGSNMPVGLVDGLRLKRCARCAVWFIALAPVRLCSDSCRAAAKREANVKQIAKRTEARQRRRESLQVACQMCGQPVEKPSRSTRAFCSNACRQAAYRARGGVPAPPRPKPAKPAPPSIDDQIAGLKTTMGLLGVALQNGGDRESCTTELRKMVARLGELEVERKKLGAE
jgi:hypothetical protein